MVYRTEDAAVKRIEVLKGIGVWPGYYRVTGGWALTYDPPLSSSRSAHEGEVLA
jgi:hypothetical protein